MGKLKDGLVVKMLEMPDKHLDWKELERLVEERFGYYHENRLAHIKRYGVQAYGSTNASGGAGWTPIRSFPDYDGVLFPHGRQIVFDAKVSSEASFYLSNYKWLGADSKPYARQLRHMLQRADAGCLCAFLIHFNARSLKSSEQAAVTWLFPVHPSLRFWESFLEGEVSSISRADCDRLGIQVVWNRLGLDRTLRPDVLMAFQELACRKPFDLSVQG